MLRIRVDTNRCDDDGAIVILPKSVPEEELKVGARVILYETGFECEATLRHGKRWNWVADIIEGTIRDIPVDE